MPFGVTWVAMFFFAVILIAAVLVDLRRHRIPNTLSFSAAGIGLALQGTLLGLDGLLAGLAGLAVGLAILLPFHVMGAMGAGDVKLMAGIGAFLGPKGALLAGGLTLIAGALLGLAVLFMRGGGADWLRRMGATLRLLWFAGHVGYAPPAPGAAATAKFPYALAIALGSASALYWLAQRGMLSWMP